MDRTQPRWRHPPDHCLLAGGIEPCAGWAGYRYRDSKSSEVSDWYRTNIIPGRRLYHALLFPDRRINKSLHDSIGRILLLLDKSPNAVPNSEDYKIIARFSYDYLTKNIKSDFDIFQFLIATDTGYDETQKLNEIYLSRGEKVSKDG